MASAVCNLMNAVVFITQEVSGPPTTANPCWRSLSLHKESDEGCSNLQYTDTCSHSTVTLIFAVQKNKQERLMVFLHWYWMRSHNLLLFLLLVQWTNIMHVGMILIMYICYLRLEPSRCQGLMQRKCIIRSKLKGG